MTDVATPLPTRRPELVVAPLGDDGQHVVKDPASGDYFHLGGQEAFLLEQLDGAQSAEAICTAFEQQFDEPLTKDDLNEFVALARSRGLLSPEALPATTHQRPADFADRESGGEQVGAPLQTAAAPVSRPATTKRQSILYWRKNVFDPDRLFNWMEPQIRFVWTRGFLVCSLATIAVAAFISWTNSAQLVTRFADVFRWETLLVAWITLGLVTTCHEFAHGLTCKRYGGEVREIGFLLMFFMPCFYCNVSDAWLFREKSKRLWVTFAGGYCDLCIWAIAVLVWRITYQDSLVNYLSWVVLTVAGARVFFNFNPLIKLDGYYLLSDLTEIPNLRQRSIDYVQAHLRWLLWGADRPARRPKGKFLIGFGLVSWLFSLFFVTLMLVMMAQFLRGYLGYLGIAVVGILGLVVGRGLLQGMFAGELSKMIWKRHKRKFVWLAILIVLIVAGLLIPWTDQASGTFEVRAVTRAEVRAPVAAFLDKVYVDEGDEISQGGLIAHLSIPDLTSKIAQKDAELLEAKAKLKLLEAGPRDEEITQQKRRVDRSQAWRDVVEKDLERQALALEQDLIRFDKLLDEYAAERDYAEQITANYEKLRQRGTITDEEYLAARKQQLVTRAQYDKTLAEKQARAALGTLTAESELAEREKELTVDQAALALLEAGTRAEEIEAAQATVARLTEEIKYLRDVQQRLAITSPVAGSITTPRLKEKKGNYFPEGELICEIEDPRHLEVVIELDEDQAALVQPGQKVRLKPRALPFEVFEVQVERIAPRAVEGELQSQVTVYCKLEDAGDKLRSGMTGHARIHCGSGPIGVVYTKHVMRYLRTEFWW